MEIDRMVANHKFIDIVHRCRTKGELRLTGERRATETGTRRSGGGDWKHRSCCALVADPTSEILLRGFNRLERSFAKFLWWLCQMYPKLYPKTFRIYASCSLVLQLGMADISQVL
jgi:hypothetical protein